MSRVQRLMKNRERSLRKRISQSMQDAGRATPKCRRLQRKLNRVQQARRVLRYL